MAPRLYVEIAFASPYNEAPVWTDVTSWVLLKESQLKIRRGRQNERSQVSPSTLQGLVLDNSDGRFTPGNAAGPYYPNVKIARLVRVRYLETTGKNRMVHVLSGDARGWYGSGTPFGKTTCAVEPYLTYAKVTWPATAAARQTVAWTMVDNLTVGQQYTVSADVWVPAGAPAVQIGAASGAWGPSAASTVNNAFQRLSVTFTAAAQSYAVGMLPSAATTAGQLAWTKDWMIEPGAAATAFDATGTTEYARFTGPIDSWKPQPAGGGYFKATEVSATDRSGRLASRGPTVRSVFEEEINLAGPLAYYPLTDGSDATEAGDVSANRQPPLRPFRIGVNGAMSWGEDSTGPVGGSAVVLSPDYTFPVMPDGYLLETTLLTPAVYNTGGKAVVMEVWVRPSLFAGLTPGPPMQALWLSPASPLFAGDGLGIVVRDGLGRVELRYQSNSLFTSYLSEAPLTLGQWAHVVGVAAPASTTLYVNGVPAYSTASAIAAGALTYTLLGVGGSRVGNPCLWAGSLAHAAVYSTTQVPTDEDIRDRYLAGLNGLSGERTDERIARLLGYAGIDTATAVLESGLSTMGRQDAGGLMDLLREVEATEAGLLFVDGADTLRFHSRAHRYSRTPSVTYTADQIEDNLDPVLDDAFLLNEQRVTRRGGATYRAVDEPSVNEHGAYSNDLTIATDSDQFAADMAAYLVRRYKNADLRSPSLTIDLLTQPGLVTATLGRELGDRVGLTGLPADLPAGLSALDVEGIEDTIGLDVWTVAFNTSPARTEPGWFLGTAGKSELGFTTYLAF